MTISMNNIVCHQIQPKTATNNVKNKENDLTDSQEQKITVSGVPDETHSSRTKIPNNNVIPVLRVSKIN